LKEKGKSLNEAIIEAGKVRMRPILMTSLTTILALMTLALGIGEGAKIMQPMAITTIGGLFFATVLTLLVVPCIYMIFDNIKDKVRRRN
jgi:multidrug efflux pump subunit AcrB